MLAGLALHVDLADRDLDRQLHRPDDRLGLAGQGQDAAVVAGVAGPVEEERAGRPGDRRGQAIDDLDPAALGEVGNALDEPGHALHRATSGGCPAPSRRRMSAGAPAVDAGHASPKLARCPSPPEPAPASSTTPTFGSCGWATRSASSAPRSASWRSRSWRSSSSRRRAFEVALLGHGRVPAVPALHPAGRGLGRPAPAPADPDHRRRRPGAAA